MARSILILWVQKPSSLSSMEFMLILVLLLLLFVVFVSSIWIWSIYIYRERDCRLHIAYCIWPMAYGLWSMAYGQWPMAYGLLTVASGIWPLAYGLWPVVYACVQNHKHAQAHASLVHTIVVVGIIIIVRLSKDIAKYKAKEKNNLTYICVCIHVCI